jgi:hypothetical protein
VLSGRGLCDELVPRPEESYRVWCVIVKHRNEEAKAPEKGLLRQRKKMLTLNYLEIRNTYEKIWWGIKRVSFYLVGHKVCFIFSITFVPTYFSLRQIIKVLPSRRTLTRFEDFA